MQDQEQPARRSAHAAPISPWSGEIQRQSALSPGSPQEIVKAQSTEATLKPLAKGLNGTGIVLVQSERGLIPGHTRRQKVSSVKQGTDSSYFKYLR